MTAPKMGLLEDWLESAPSRPGELARPLVTLSYAQSLDGSIALRRGQPLALSGAESLKLTHRLRALHDVVLVGIGTILADDPQLNVRLAPGKDPDVVILDSRLRLPSKARVNQDKGSPRVFCTALAEASAKKTLEAAGLQVERQDSNRTDRVDLRPMLARLHALGVNSLMVEGGGQIISSFLADGLVDKAVIILAPRYVGGYKAVDVPLEIRARLPGLQAMQFAPYGQDLVVWGNLEGA